MKCHEMKRINGWKSVYLEEEGSLRELEAAGVRPTGHCHWIVVGFGVVLGLTQGGSIVSSLFACEHLRFL